MRERAMRWGGQFTIEPRDGGGTTVRLRVPLTQAPA
jgi:signal transduction histidine kinase